MNLVVLLAGIADPKRPLPRPVSGDSRDIWETPDLAYKLSPFDEAALEVGLKLRIAHPGTHLTVLVTDAAADPSLLRTVAAFRPDHLQGIARPAAERWDSAALARHIRTALSRIPNTPDILLMGREHGDGDDGSAAPFLAESLGYAYAGLALDVRWQDGRVLCTRDFGGGLETVTLPTPAWASISNDKGNRLRHPLLKNVLHAKQQTFAAPAAGVAESTGGVTDSADAVADSGDGIADFTAALMLIHAAPPPSITPGDAPCRLLLGTLQEQARALACYLCGEAR